MLTTCSEGEGALICSTDNFSGGNIPIMADIKLSAWYLMQVWEGMHTIGSPKPVRIGSMPAPFLLTCLPSFLPMTGERAAEEQGPNRSVAPAFPLWDYVLETMDHP